MTPQEKDLLTRFVQQLSSAQAGQKDAEAEAMIRDAFARQPDAAYLLTQRTLQLEQLLQASQEQVKKQQAELEQSRAGSGGFLNDPNAWGSRPSAAPVQQRSEGRFGGANNAAQAAQNARGGSWGSGLFGNIAATAAGVVAGSFLFQGIQGLMNGNESGSNADNTASADGAGEQAQTSEPELLNSYDTASADDSFGGDLGGGDFG